MAHFSAQPLSGHAETNVLLWSGQLVVDAGGALNSASWGKGATYTKGSNGEYTLTLSAAYRVKNAAHGAVTVTIMKAAAGLQAVELKSVDLSTGVIVLRFIETAVAGAGTDPAAACSAFIRIELFNTTLPKG
jgi:hypothetical protein